MSYTLKKDMKSEIKKKYKCMYIAEQLGKTQSYISLVINRKLSIPKTTAYAFTKVLNSEAEIEDYFDRI